MSVARTCWLAFVAVMLSNGSHPVLAQTVANGPYYVSPSWDQSLPSSTRFVILSNMDSAAVLDRETGLVWEKAPSTFAFPQIVPANLADTASRYCLRLTLGNKRGWRLPSVQELASLMDPSHVIYGIPDLPPGHPFVNVQPIYWTATQTTDNPKTFWIVLFGSGGIGLDDGDVTLHPAWCVRGGQGPNPQ